MKTHKDKHAEDQQAVENLRDRQAERAIERQIDMNNRALWVATGHSLKDMHLFTGTRAIDKGGRP